jgi:regulator of replication initiation timing
MLGLGIPVRRFLLLLTLTLCFSTATRLPAQVPDPGAAQDEESAREKQLKAADDLANMQANSEATKVAVDGMRSNVSALQATVTQLQTDNAALKQQLTDLQAAFDQYKADQVKERQTLVDNVAAMIAAGKATKKKKDSASTETPALTSSPTSSPNPALTPPPDPSQPAQSATTDATPPSAPKPQKGYYHVVASGETLTMIVAAYRDNGVHVTIGQIRKANGLTEDSELKPGQKLFIPKPGT